MGESGIRVMVVTPHPDDAESGAGGTVASWVRQGREVVYAVCTNGDKGSSDPDMTSERLVQLREQEQREAAQILGVSDVIFLGYPDGGLEDTPAFRRELVRLIRKHRPDVVMTSDPLRRYLWHRDHRITGLVTLDASFTYAQYHLFYPELAAEGVMPHRVREVYLWGSEEPDTFVDITETFSLKLAALMCHDSQVGQYAELVGQRMKERASMLGQSQGIPLAEGFRRVNIVYSDLGQQC